MKERKKEMKKVRKREIELKKHTQKGEKTNLANALNMTLKDARSLSNIESHLNEKMSPV